MTSDIINREIVVGLLRLGNKLNEELNTLTKQFGISLPQFNVLRILRGQKGKPANLSTLNQHMIHKMSNTTRLVDKLIEKELVKRCVCENNRRKVEITITTAGLGLLAQLDNQLIEKESQLVNTIKPTEKEELIALISKLQ
ncbi:MAG: MarR family winged helix-turn-helix transcriptional regulator [Flavobacteriaceae bacterium]